MSFSLLKKFKQSLFLKTLTLILKHKKRSSYIIFLDIFYVILLFGFSLISTQLLPDDPTTYLTIFGNVATALTASIAVALVYLLILLLIYSFFKYGILDLIHSFIRKTDFSFNNLRKFYRLNLLIFSFPALTFILFYLFAVLVFQYRPALIIAWFILILIALITYPFYNIAHSLFTRNYPLKKIMQRTLTLLTRPKIYLPVYAFSLAVIGLYLLSFYILGLVLGNTAFSDPLTFQQYYSAYATLFTTLLTLTLYALIFFNRIYIYVIVEKWLIKK